VLVTERRLWQSLAALPAPSARARFFHDYLSVKFALHTLADQTAPARAALRYSYVHCLRHWGVDSNGPSGAALKSWVENRFGLRPTYHAGHLDSDAGARARYDLDRMRGAARTIGLSQQLDLLYTYCQQELARRHPGERWLTLYRGTHDADEYAVRTPAANPGHGLLVEFNNLSSFTAEREVAWEFGSSVWAVRVPLAKILCFNSLLPPEFLQGESEYLVLGGVHRVTPLRG
jgi:NAD+--dinitrogen-reductase ADP-D-ribosyltransferase